MADYVDLLLKVPPELAKKLLNKETAEVVTRWMDARFEAFTKCSISLADSSKEETVRSMMKAVRQQKINNVGIGKLNKILKTIENSDSSLGSAMLAGVALGIFESPKDAVNKCMKVCDTVVPNKENTPKYRKAFERYKKIALALAPIYREGTL